MRHNWFIHAHWCAISQPNLPKFGACRFLDGIRWLMCAMQKMFKNATLSRWRDITYMVPLFIFYEACWASLSKTKDNEGLLINECIFKSSLFLEPYALLRAMVANSLEPKASHKHQNFGSKFCQHSESEMSEATLSTSFDSAISFASQLPFLQILSESARCWPRITEKRCLFATEAKRCDICIQKKYQICVFFFAL